MSTGYPNQYGQPADQWPDEPPFDPNAHNGGDPDDFEFGDVAFNKTADEIADEAKSRDFKPVPAGTHEFFVAGFFKAPEPVTREGYLNGQHVSWFTHKVGVRLAMVADPQATILDFFDLPPADPTDLHRYLNASKGSDGKNPGFMAEKFGHFIARLGFVYPKGAPIPAEAKRLGNWRNRRIVATVEAQRPKAGEQVTIDPTTGRPYPPRMQVRLFSYEPSPATVAGHAPNAPASAPVPAPVPAHHQAPAHHPATQQGRPSQPTAPYPQQGQPQPATAGGDRMQQFRGNL